jgi:hypothetical protein
MTTNNSPIGYTPSELLFGNNEKTTNLDQFLAVEIVTTSQPFIQFNTTNMLPSQTQLLHNVPQNHRVTRRQQGRIRRRHRRRQHQHQRRGDQQQQQEEQQQRQQNQQQPRQQNQHPQQQATGQQFRGWFEVEWDHDNWEYLDYPEYMEENTTPLVEAYDWEKMHPKNRWEQEQLNELENFSVSQQLTSIQDEIEQLHQIEAVEKLQEEEEQQRNRDQLIQLQQYEHIAFLHQQLNQN